MPERSAWPVSVSIASRPILLRRTRQRQARRESVLLGKSPDRHPPPRGMDVRLERETRGATPGTSNRQCLHRGTPPPWHRIRCRSGRQRKGSPSETESAPTSTEERG